MLSFFAKNIIYYYSLIHLFIINQRGIPIDIIDIASHTIDISDKTVSQYDNGSSDIRLPIPNATKSRKNQKNKTKNMSIKKKIIHATIGFILWTIVFINFIIYTAKKMALILASLIGF